MKVDSYLDKVMKDLKRAEKSLNDIKKQGMAIAQPSDFIIVAERVDSFMERSGGREKYGSYNVRRSSRYNNVEWIDLDKTWTFEGKSGAELQKIANDVRQFARTPVNAYAHVKSSNEIKSTVSAPLYIQDAEDEGLPTP